MAVAGAFASSVAVGVAVKAAVGVAVGVAVRAEVVGVGSLRLMTLYAVSCVYLGVRIGGHLQV